MNETESTPVGLLDKDFCVHLEFHLCRTFDNSDEEALRGFWCDGVEMPFSIDPYFTKKIVIDSRKIDTYAYIGKTFGKTGYDIYQMTIRFGKYSLKRYAQGMSLIEYIPSEKTMDWIYIDIENKTIEIRLR